MPEVTEVQVPVRNESDYYEVETRVIPSRSRERERGYEEHIVYRPRPKFLSDDYDRSDRAPLVLRERKIDRRRRSPSPVRTRERIVEREREPSSPPVERVKPRIVEQERPRPEVRYARRERDSSPIIERVRVRSRSPSPSDWSEVDEYIRPTQHREIDEVVWDLSRTKDVTMHLELGITEDLELDLDEFCRLGRLGNFHQAKQYFRDNLEQHMNDPYIFVQYAQMLMEMGDYKSIKALNAPYSLEESENHLLQTNWKLIQSLSTLRTGGLVEHNEMVFAQKAARAVARVPPDGLEIVNAEFPKKGKTRMPIRLVSKRAIIDLGYPFEEEGDVIIIQKALERENIDEVLKLSEEYKASEGELPYSSLPRVRAQYRAAQEQEVLGKNLEKEKAAADVDEISTLGSTECQILNLSLRCIAYFHRYTGIVIEMFDWAIIYENMLRQGRIWDFRDIFTGAVFYYGQERAYDEFFGSSANPLNRILGDWSTAIYDECTSLALLDILVSLVLARQLSSRTIAGATHFVDSASLLASSIVQNQPSNLKSRQYIRWILAKVAVTSYDIASSSALSEFPGLFLTNAVALDLYIYIPAASETPDWHLLCLPSKSFETLQMVLKAARELEDLETEALCLKQLIAHSRDPIEYFDELIRLQKIIQKDIAGWLQTCLSKYLICRDKQSTDCLREEILSVRDYDKLDPELVWARSMVLRALAHSDHEANLSLDEARETLHRSMLSMNIRDFMERNKLVAAGREPSIPSKSRNARTEATWHRPMDSADDASNEEKEDAPGGTNGTKLDNKSKANADVWTAKTQPAEELVFEEVPNGDLTKVDQNAAAAFSKTSTLSPKESVPLDVGRNEEPSTTIEGKISSDYDRNGVYSPSSLPASGGSYYPTTNQFPPPSPPPGPIDSFTQPTNTQAPPENTASIPPYNPADSSGQRQQPHHNSPQNLSKIYVTIDSASSEPREAVNPTATLDREDKKPNGLSSHTSDREPELEVSNPQSRSKHRYR
ncbi:hypothetical protein ACMFMG_003019 [Clarireedia jacksonii]